ncbi:hypothetical protein ACTFIR_010650 [Dictyostelium discoideum]
MWSKSQLIFFIIILYNILFINGNLIDTDYSKTFKPFLETKNKIGNVIKDPKTEQIYVIGEYQTQPEQADKTFSGNNFYTLAPKIPIPNFVFENSTSKTPKPTPTPTPTPSNKTKSKTPKPIESSSSSSETDELISGIKKNYFKVIKASIYDGCVAYLGKGLQDGNTFIAMYNLNDVPDFYQVDSSHNYLSLSIDDTFIWATYKEANQVYLKPIIHDGCKKIIHKNDPYVPMPVNITNPEAVISQPITSSNRFIYIYDSAAHVLVKFTHSSSLQKFEETEGGRLNVLDACSVRLYRYDQEKRNTYWMVSKKDGFTLYNERSEKSISLTKDGDTTDYCAPFATKGLDTFYALPGSDELSRSIPGVSFEVTHPCYGDKGTGEIKILAPPGVFQIKWEDQLTATKSLIRKNLKDGDYILQYWLSGIDDSTDMVRKNISIITPENPMFINVTHACLNAAQGVFNFTNLKHPDFSYEYILYSEDGKKPVILKDGSVFPGLYGDKNYTVNITTTSKDVFKHQCTYSVKEFLPNDKVEKPIIEYTNLTCADSKDARIKIVNFKPEKYNYIVTPTKYNITSEGTIENISDLNIVIKAEIKGGVCSQIVSVDIYSPPAAKVVKEKLKPKVIKSPCYGSKGSIKVASMDGIDFELTDSKGKVHQPFINKIKTLEFNGLIADKYILEAKIKSTRGESLYCGSVSNNLTLAQPKRIQIIDTLIESIDCTRANLANMTITAAGGTQYNGSYYDFTISSGAISHGHYLNVSYWVDGIYSLNISDSKGCVAVYNNITIKRPNKCQVHNINGIHPHGPNSIQNGGNGNGNPKKDDKNKLGLILGLCLGIGIPFIILATVLTVVLVKKFGHRFSRTPTMRNQPRPNTVPVFMGGKIHNIDNF